MYLQLNSEERSCNNCWRGEAINITYPECMFVALGGRLEMRIRRVVICGLSGSKSTFSQKWQDFRAHY